MASYTAAVALKDKIFNFIGKDLKTEVNVEISNDKTEVRVARRGTSAAVAGMFSAVLTLLLIVSVATGAVQLQFFGTAVAVACH